MYKLFSEKLPYPKSLDPCISQCLAVHSNNSRKKEEEKNKISAGRVLKSKKNPLFMPSRECLGTKKLLFKAEL